MLHNIIEVIDPGLQEVEDYNAETIQFNGLTLIKRDNRYELLEQDNPKHKKAKDLNKNFLAYLDMLKMSFQNEEQIDKTGTIVYADD